MATKSTPKAPATDKRKAADNALEARIAARKAAAPKKVTVVTTTTEELPFTPDPAPVSETRPDLPQPVKPRKAAAAPKEKKPRTPKPKAEAPVDVKGVVEKIEARATAKAEKAHAKVLKGVNAHYKAEIKKLKAEHKKANMAQSKLQKAAAVAEFNKGFEKGFAKGKAAASKSLLASLKGR